MRKKTIQIDIIIAIAILLGFLIPTISSTLYPYIMYAVMTIMFLNFLKIEYKESISYKTLFLYIASNILIIPFVAYLLTHNIEDPQLKIGLMFCALAPSAIMCPVYASFVGGSRLQATTISVFSNLFSVISIPGLLFLYTGTLVKVDYTQLLLKITYIIVLPYLLALIIKRNTNAVKILTKHYDLTVKSIVFTTIYTIIGKNSTMLLNKNMIPLLLLVFLLTLLSFLMGWILGVFAQLKKLQRNTLTICTGIRNSALIIGIIVSSFEPRVGIPAISYIIFHQSINAILVRLYNKGVI
jgi:predicted Na+-dependent transporter